MTEITVRAADSSLAMEEIQKNWVMMLILSRRVRPVDKLK